MSVCCSWQFYSGDSGEFSPNPRDAFRTCADNGEEEDCETVGQVLSRAQGATDPVFKKYGVDVYNAGHAHECDPIPFLLSVALRACPCLPPSLSLGGPVGAGTA